MFEKNVDQISRIAISYRVSTLGRSTPEDVREQEATYFGPPTLIPFRNKSELMSIHSRLSWFRIVVRIPDSRYELYYELRKYG